MLSGLSSSRTGVQICSQWSRSLNKVPHNFATPGVVHADLTARFEVLTPAEVARRGLKPFFRRCMVFLVYINENDEY